jgi:hypothetical protein
LDHTEGSEKWNIKNEITKRSAGAGKAHGGMMLCVTTMQKGKAMKVRVTLDLEVGDQTHADAVSYFIYQYGSTMRPEQPWANVEVPTSDDTAEGVEAVMLDVIQDVCDMGEIDGAWEIKDSHVRVVS